MTPVHLSKTSGVFATTLVTFTIAMAAGPFAVSGFAQGTGAPRAIPGVVQAEDFDTGEAEIAYHDNSIGNSGGAYRDTDVDIEGTRDAGAGYNIGWVSAGEWLTYTVSVANAGSYTIEVRVASPGTGGTFHVEANGIDKTGPLAVPNTGGWQVWTTVTRANVMLVAGEQSVRLMMDRVGSNGAVGNFNWIRVTSSAGGESTPYSGTPVALPGTIEAENFDNGGAGIAYHDRSLGNSGGAFRDSDVDLEGSRDAGGGFNIGWVGSGEWLKYTVNVASAGTYTIEVRVASSGPGGTFHVEANAVDKTGLMAVPNTGGWQVWTTVAKIGVSLAAGPQVLRFVADAVGSNGAVGNINWIRVVATPSAGSTPFGGTPVAVPGTIQAENFDDGGAEIAYHDTSAGNSGGVYRKTDVDLQGSRDAGGGYNVGWVAVGEWLNYTVSVATAGSYTIEVRVASPGGGGAFHLEADGANATGTIAVPNTGSWQVWSTVAVTGVSLDAGTQVLRLVMDTMGASGSGANFNWIRIGFDQTPFAIVAPAPGTTLRTARVTFQWTGDGDEFWLNIGSAPGGNDVYASGSLGPATAHTVENLPLSGRTIHVEVRRRIGGTTTSAHAQYIAPVRRALAVITDFSDRTLESWTGGGMKSVADVSAELRKMEDHWKWLSRGRETMQWDIIRIRLTQAAVPDAFSSWVHFRDTIASLAKQQVDIRDYDVNGDDVLDVSWFIVCSGDANVGEYAIGGASRQAGVNLFVDGQASPSVKGGHTGNFNHEVAHLLGIPELYGKYGTLGDLTIMTGSWDLPPNDFTAYERTLLGWITPRVVSQTTTRIWLPPPDNQMAAVKVPTLSASEYFLIEYRKVPASGYGSADTYHNGLVIYHVLEGSSQLLDPPLLKVEPADGRITPGVPTDPNDLVYPGNPYWIPPMVLYSYYGDGQEVFRVDNVAWLDGGIAFDITMAAPRPAPGLLANASFESGDTHPASWMTGGYDTAPESFAWSSSAAVTGARSVHIASSSASDRWWGQAVTLVPFQKYLLCGWLKGEAIAVSSGEGGASISMTDSPPGAESLRGTFDWTLSCVAFTAYSTYTTAACRLGSYYTFAHGKVWCDDMSLQRAGSAFRTR